MAETMAGGPVARAQRAAYARGVTPMAIATPDEGRLLDVNAAFAATFGVNAERLVGGTVADLLHPDDRPPTPALPGPAGATPWVARARARPGSWRVLRWTVRRDPPTGLVLVAIEDLTSARFVSETLLHQLHHDPLTGVGSRRLLDRSLRRTVAHPAGHPAVLVVRVDLDGLAGVTHDHGRQVGDDCLRSVGERLRSRVRPHDVVARLEGDAFAMVLETSATEHDAAAQVASVVGDHLLGTLREPVHSGGHDIALAPSAGVAAWPYSGADADEILAAADRALVRARRRAPGSLALCPQLQAGEA